jgi:tetratricopeptide (TPR) repeat protein
MMWLHSVAARFLGHYLPWRERRRAELVDHYVGLAMVGSTYSDLQSPEYWAQQALELHPRHPSALASLARIKVRQKKRRDALELFQDALDAAQDVLRESPEGNDLGVHEDFLGDVALDAALCAAQLYQRHPSTKQQDRWMRQVAHWARIVELECPTDLARLLSDPLLVDLRDRLLQTFPIAAGQVRRWRFASPRKGKCKLHIEKHARSEDHP